MAENGQEDGQKTVPDEKRVGDIGRNSCEVLILIGKEDDRMAREIAFAPVDKMTTHYNRGKGVNQNLLKRFVDSEFDLVEVLEVGEKPRVKAANLYDCAKKNGYKNVKVHLKGNKVYLEKVN